MAERKYLDLELYTNKHNGDKITDTIWNGVFNSIEESVNNIFNNTNNFEYKNDRDIDDSDNLYSLGQITLPKNIINNKNILTQSMFYKHDSNGELLLEDGAPVPITNTVFIIKYDYYITEDSFDIKLLTPGENPKYYVLWIRLANVKEGIANENNPNYYEWKLIVLPYGTVLKFEGGCIHNNTIDENTGRHVDYRINALKGQNCSIVEDGHMILDYVPIGPALNNEYIKASSIGVTMNNITDNGARLNTLFFYSYYIYLDEIGLGSAISRGYNYYEVEMPIEIPPDGGKLLGNVENSDVSTIIVPIENFYKYYPLRGVIETRNYWVGLPNGFYPKQLNRFVYAYATTILRLQVRCNYNSDYGVVSWAVGENNTIEHLHVTGARKACIFLGGNLAVGRVKTCFTSTSLAMLEDTTTCGYLFDNHPLAPPSKFTRWLVDPETLLNDNSYVTAYNQETKVYTYSTYQESLSNKVKITYPTNLKNGESLPPIKTVYSYKDKTTGNTVTESINYFGFTSGLGDNKDLWGYISTDYGGPGFGGSASLVECSGDNNNWTMLGSGSIVLNIVAPKIEFCRNAVYSKYVYNVYSKTGPFLEVFLQGGRIQFQTSYNEMDENFWYIPARDENEDIIYTTPLTPIGTNSRYKLEYLYIYKINRLDNFERNVLKASREEVTHITILNMSMYNNLNMAYYTDSNIVVKKPNMYNGTTPQWTNYVSNLRELLVLDPVNKEISIDSTELGGGILPSGKIINDVAYGLKYGYSYYCSLINKPLWWEGDIRNITINNKEYRTSGWVDYNGNQYLIDSRLIDLGLPSGRLWSSRNLDLTLEDNFTSSEFSYDCTYFSYGNTWIDSTTGLKSTDAVNGKYNGIYNNSSNGGYNFSDYNLTPGGLVINTLQIDIYTDRYNDYDAAHANLGTLYRMPTYSEINELITHCIFLDSNGDPLYPEGTKIADINNEKNTISPIILKGEVYGIWLKGPNNNTIFFPASGRILNGSFLPANKGEFVYLVSKNISPTTTSNISERFVYSCAFYNVRTNNSFIALNNYNLSRDKGVPIRPVV